MASYVIVVESTELGVESVHGPYAVEEVTRAQAIIRSQPSDRSRRATIVKLTADATAIGDEHHTTAMLDSVLARYDGLVLIRHTALALLFEEANGTGHYEQADDLRDALTEQKAEVADALVSLLRKGFIPSPADGTPDDYRLEAGPVEEIGWHRRHAIGALRNEARTDAWRERKLHEIGREIAEEFKSEEES